MVNSLLNKGKYMNKNNLIELQPGTYEMDLLFEIPEGTWTKEDVSVDVKISERK